MLPICNQTRNTHHQQETRCSNLMRKHAFLWHLLRSSYLCIATLGDGLEIIPWLDSDGRFCAAQTCYVNSTLHRVSTTPSRRTVASHLGVCLIEPVSEELCPEAGRPSWQLAHFYKTTLVDWGGPGERGQGAQAVFSWMPAFPVVALNSSCSFKQFLF